MLETVHFGHEFLDMIQILGLSHVRHFSHDGMSGAPFVQPMDSWRPFFLERPHDDLLTGTIIS